MIILFYHECIDRAIIRTPNSIFFSLTLLLFLKVSLFLALVIILINLRVIRKVIICLTMLEWSDAFLSFNRSLSHQHLAFIDFFLQPVEVLFFLKFFLFPLMLSFRLFISIDIVVLEKFLKIFWFLFGKVLSQIQTWA